MSDATLSVWLELWPESCVEVNAVFLYCWWCKAEMPGPHMHIYREFEDYRDASSGAAAGVCSEGCAIEVVKARGYTVIPKPAAVRTGAA